LYLKASGVELEQMLARYWPVQIVYSAAVTSPAHRQFMMSMVLPVAL